jgi:hypothetical protein
LGVKQKLKGGTQIRTGGKGFADPCLTTWRCRRRCVITFPAFILSCIY